MRKMRLLSGVLGALVAVAVLLSPAVGHALSLDFSYAGPASGVICGPLCYGDGVNVYGDLVITTLVVHDSAGFDGSYAVSNGELVFDTGANYLFMLGGIADLGLAYGALIDDGSFNSFQWFPGNAFQGAGTDVKDPALLRAIGAPLDTPFAFFGFSIGLAGAGPSCQESGPDCLGAISTDIVNTAVPEPASLLLMGSGLAGLGLWGWKRRREGVQV